MEMEMEIIRTLVPICMHQRMQRVILSFTEMSIPPDTHIGLLFKCM